MAPSSHSLNALPIELLVFVIESLDCVEDIASLALTNRRLYSTANSLLYRRAALCGDARPLAWAANRGLVSTLRMALAAGLDPDYEFVEPLPVEEWQRASASARADAAAGRPKQLWAMWDYSQRPRLGVEWSPEPAEDASTPAATSTIPPSPRAPSTSDQDSIASSDEDLSQRSDATPATETSPTPTPDTVRRTYTALHLAARGGHDEVIKLLVRHGAGTNISSEYFCACTPLYGLLNALEHPEPETDIHPWTPLHVAICHARTETAKLLLSSPVRDMLERRADFDMSYTDLHYNTTALHYAAGMGLTDLVRYILDNKIQTDVNVRLNDTLTPFYHAYASRRWDSTVPLLLERGADINCETKMYIPYTAITPLGEACRLGDFDAADRLMDLGADVTKGFLAVAKSGCLTPLHMCCMRSAQPAGEPGHKGDDDEARGRARMRTIGRLIARGAALDARDCFGSTPLMAAVQACNTFALEALSIAGVEAEGEAGGGKKEERVEIKNVSRPDAAAEAGS
jgi:ankyrin repeat protein